MRVSASMDYGQAVVLYELLRRYHESGNRELVPDRAEWRALVLFLGELERQLADGRDQADVERDFQRARRELGEYDGVPF